MTTTTSLFAYVIILAKPQHVTESRNRQADAASLQNHWPPLGQRRLHRKTRIQISPPSQSRPTHAKAGGSKELNAVSPKPTETSVTETTVSTDGLTRSVATDLDSNGTADRINTHTLVNNPDGSRVETTTDTGNNGTLLDKVISTTSANGKTTTTTIDRNGDGLVDLTTLKQMTVNADGSSKIMAANENRNIKHHQKVAA
jgi:hypothetical protein